MMKRPLTATAFKASLVANVVLLVTVVYLLPRTWDKQHSSSTTPATFPARQPVSAAARPFWVSFQWSQLESEDYPTYIANLRAIGCPERTIRDIVAADLHALLTERRKTPRQQGDGLESDEARVLLELFGPGDTEVIRRD